MSAMVDLQNTDGRHFSEPFYILLMEKVPDGAMMHMWRLVLSSEPDSGEAGHGGTGNGDSDSSGSVTPDVEHPGDQSSSHHHQMSQVHVSTEKVSSMKLPLPDGVEVVHAVSAVGHLSSSSIYPACLAPYVIVTACSGEFVFKREQCMQLRLERKTRRSNIMTLMYFESLDDLDKNENV